MYPFDIIDIICLGLKSVTGNMRVWVDKLVKNIIH